ncbi:MAG: AI-2E family transporter [Clostridia bacterium]|nr:AI-2E family transporter [Clostridia bacterium]
MGNGRKWLLLIVMIPAAFALLFFFSKCIGVIRVALIALVISYLLSPLISILERRMPRSLAILVVYASLILVFAGIIALAFFPMLKELSSLPEHAYRLGNTLRSLAARFSDRLSEKGIMADVLSPVQNALSAGAGRILTYVLSALSGAAGFLANALVALALSWFFLIDWEKMSLRMFLVVPSGIRPKVITALQTVRRELGGYLRAQSLLILIMFVSTVSVLWIFRVPMPVSLGGTYALLNAIPYFGPLIGTIAPVLAAFTVSPVKALIVLSSLLLIQQADNYVLSPRIMGAAANSGPATVLIAISAGGALYGVTGMFLALPVLVTVKSVYRVFTAPRA